MADNLLTNLIINYLPQTLSDEEFRSLFVSIGAVKSCKIIRDKSSGYSYGFGFVDYVNKEDAQKAIENLNGLKMQHKTLKVAFARQGNEIKGANLYIRNLPKTWGDDELSSYFSQYGSIVQSRVLVDHNSGESKGVGFILFNQKSEAETARRALHGKIPPGAILALTVKFADDQASKIQAPGVEYPPARQNYMHGGGYNQFQSPGPMRNPRNRFHFNPMAQGGPTPYSGEESGHILFIYNIGPDADEKLLWQLFGPCGTVQKINIIMDSSTGCCKGYGFVTMTHYEEAVYAIECYNGYWHNGRQLQVSFKK